MTADATTAGAALDAGRPSRGQCRILRAICGGARLFRDGFHYSLMWPWSGSRELVTVRMVKTLRDRGWIDGACRFTPAGTRAAATPERPGREDGED